MCPTPSTTEDELFSSTTAAGVQRAGHIPEKQSKAVAARLTRHSANPRERQRECERGRERDRRKEAEAHKSLALCHPIPSKVLALSIPARAEPSVMFSRLYRRSNKKSTIVWMHPSNTELLRVLLSADISADAGPQGVQGPIRDCRLQSGIWPTACPDLIE